MSVTVLRILLQELEQVRLTCKSCQSVVELNINSDNFRGIQICPLCRAKLIDNHSGRTALDSLSVALNEIKKATNLGMEFVIPAKESQ